MFEARGKYIHWACGLIENCVSGTVGKAPGINEWVGSGNDGEDEDATAADVDDDANERG